MKKSKPFSILHLTGIKFAITANLLFLLLAAYSLIGKSYAILVLFSFALVYFIASGLYTAYFEIFER